MFPVLGAALVVFVNKIARKRNPIAVRYFRFTDK